MPSSEKIRIAPLSDADIPATFDMVSLSFGPEAPFVDAYFPARHTPTGRAHGAQRLLAWKNGAPGSQFLKAVVAGDGGEEVIVGMGVWTYMVEAPPQTLQDSEGEESIRKYWGDKESREWMDALWREYVKPRTRAVLGSGGKGVYVLELLAVHPHYRRLGAGAALMKAGTDAADEKGVGAVIEATAAGRLLYERCGFECDIEEMDFNVGERFSSKEKPKLSFMVKHAVAAS